MPKKKKVEVEANDANLYLVIPSPRMTLITPSTTLKWENKKVHGR